MRASLFALLIALPGPALAAAPDLGVGAERFAGTRMPVDPRLARRGCAPDGFVYAWAGQAVEARCPATGERLLLPLPVASEQPRLKRGESVQADFVGNGFRLTVGAVAEAGDRDGRVTLRNSRSGQRFGARMDQSGRIIVSDSGD